MFTALHTSLLHAVAMNTTYARSLYVYVYVYVCSLAYGIHRYAMHAVRVVKAGKSSLAVIMIMLLWCGSSDALAQNLDSEQNALEIYTIAPISALGSGTNDVEARTKALNGARMRAFILLTKRLTAQQVPQISRRDLAALIRDISFSQERQGEGNYSAIISVTFWPNRVRQWFQNNGISFVEQQKRSVVVLPVLCRFNDCVLWEKNNRWLVNWTTTTPDDAPSFNVIVPQGDITDVATISGLSVTQKRQRDVQAIRVKYAADVVVGTVMTLGTQATPTSVSSWIMIDGAFVGQDSFTSSNISLQGWDQLREQVLRWVASFLYEYYANLKNANNRTIFVYAQLDSLKDYAKIWEAFNNNSAIDSAELIEQSSRESLFKVRMRTSIEQFARALQTTGILLTQKFETQAGSPSYQEFNAIVR